MEIPGGNFENLWYNEARPTKEHTQMDEQNKDFSEPQEQRYVPRPRWQIVLAWILLILMVVGVAGYYYWIAHRY